MAKQKAVWKSPAATAANRTSADKIRVILCDLSKGRHPARKPAALLDILTQQLERIEKIKNPREQLELLAWFLNTDALLADIPQEEEEDFFDLYADVCAFFTDLAKDFGDKDYLIDLIHDLAVNYSGTEGRSGVFLSLGEFLDSEQTHRLMESVLETLENNDLENEDDVFSALRDMADGLADPATYEKVCFLQDPDRSNATRLEAANAYYLAGNIPETQRLLKEVTNPGLEDEEEYLDLSVACAFKLGKMDEAVKTAEWLYEKFPKEIHLARLCQIVPVKRRAQLLEDHESFRIGDRLNENFIDLLISIEEYPRLGSYLEKHAEEIGQIQEESQQRFAKRLNAGGQQELAKKFKK